MSIFRGKTLMITGGTGSFGNAVLKQVPSCGFFPMEAVRTNVVKIIQSYVGIVNKMVWRKSQHFTQVTCVSAKHSLTDCAVGLPLGVEGE